MLALALIVGLTGLATAKDKNEEKVKWEDVPAAVQATITQHAKRGMVGKIEKRTEKGKVKYEAKVKGTDGKKFEVEVAEDGTFIKVE